MSLREAIQRYHDLLSDDLAAASQAQLEAQQEQRGLIFGGRPLCTVLRPRFMTPEQYRFLQSRMSMLLHALLCGNGQFAVILSTPLIRHHDEAFLKQLIPDYQTIDEEPNTFSSIWLKRV